MKFLPLPLLTLCLLTMQLACAQDSTNTVGNSLVWKFYKDGGDVVTSDTSYIYGTIHIPVKSAFKVVDTVLTLMEKVDKVYFELDLDPDITKRHAMFFVENDTSEQFQNILTRKEHAELHRKLYGHFTKKEIAFLKYLKPFAIVSLYIQKIIPSDSGLTPMDLEFYNHAKEAGKLIDGLEKHEDQLVIFDSMNLEDKKQMLLGILKSDEVILKEFNDLLDAYLAQDLLKIKQVVDSSFSVEKHLSEHDLLTDRNLKMVAVIDKYCIEHSALVGVGAAHLVGEKGLLSLLKQKGYVLEPVKKDR